MEKHKRSQEVSPSTFGRLFDARLISMLAVSAIGYYTVWASIYYLFGGNVASWLSTPLWGIPVFIVTRWDRARTPTNTPWRESLKFPQLRLWKLALVVISIFAVQFVAGFLAGLYVDDVQPNLGGDGWIEDMYAMLDLWGSAIILIVGIISSYSLGGYLAGKLSPYRYLAPYSHAAVGAFIFVMISQSVFLFFKICKCGPPNFDDVGRIALAVPITLGLSLGGAWLASHTRILKRVHALAKAFSHATKQLSRKEEFVSAHAEADPNPSAVDLPSVWSNQTKKRFSNKLVKRTRHKKKRK